MFQNVSEKPRFQIQRDKDSYTDTSLRSFEQVGRNIESTCVFSAQTLTLDHLGSNAQIIPKLKI